MIRETKLASLWVRSYTFRPSRLCVLFGPYVVDLARGSFDAIPNTVGAASAGIEVLKKISCVASAIQQEDRGVGWHHTEASPDGTEFRFLDKRERCWTRGWPPSSPASK